MIDDAKDVIERDNQSLKGVLPTNYPLPSLVKQRLGELIDLISGIQLHCSGQSDRAKIKDRNNDLVV
jgi:type I restriction enzyme M protein